MNFRKVTCLILSLALVLSGMTITGLGKTAAAPSPPNFTGVYQSGNHVKLEWATEMDSADVLTQTGFEATDEIPNMQWGGTNPIGNQSVATMSDAASGTKVLQLTDTISNSSGNAVNPPSNTESTISISTFAGKSIPSGSTLGVSFKVRALNSTDSQIYFAFTTGWFKKGFPLIDKSGKEIVYATGVDWRTSSPDYVSIKTKDNGTPNLTNGQVVHIITSRTNNYEYGLIRYTWDAANSRLVRFDAAPWNDPFPLEPRPTLVKENFPAGDTVLVYNQRTYNTPIRKLTSENSSWTTINTNVYITDPVDYDTVLKGLRPRLYWATDGILQVDDLKFGYATEVEVFRDGEAIYRGYLSDYDDTNAIDKAAPTTPGSVTAGVGTGRKPTVSWTPSTDMGTTYNYQIKGYPKYSAPTALSPQKPVTVTSGIKGYSVVIDQNPTTVPDTTIETTGTSYTGSTAINGNFYAHVAAIDNQGNMSSVAHIQFVDSIAPTLELIPDTTSWTNGQVLINVTAEDKQTGIKQLQLPNGKWVAQSSAQYSVLDNGTYTFKAEDNAGNQFEKSIMVSNIDRSQPTVSVTPNGHPWTSNDIAVQVEASDAESGLNPNGIYYKVTQSTTAPTDWELLSSPGQTITLNQEGQWFIHISATDQVGNNTTSLVGPYQYQQQPETPLLRLNSIGTDWAEIGWSLPESSFVDGYQYEVQNIVTGQSWLLDYPTDHVKEENLNAGTTYQYRIKAKNNVGESEWSKQFDVLTLPAAVDGLKVSFVPNNSGTINVSFDDVESAESYQLTIRERTGNVYEEELSTAGTHQVTGLESGKQYTVTVTAKNASGSGQSSVLGFLSLPAAPGEFQSVQIKETEVELSWNASPTATLYELLRDAVSRYSGSDLSFTDTGLKSGTEYDYSISAKNESGFGDIAYLNGVLTLPGKTKITVDEIGKDVVNFSIDTVRGAEKYVVLVNGVKEKELAPETKQFEIDSLNSGTEYTFEVYAENRSGTGVADRVTVRTLPDKPGELLITDISDATAKLSWQPVTGADKYKVTVTDDVYFETSGTDISLSDLRAGKTYQLIVQAGNASGYGRAAAKTLLTLPASPDVRIDNVQATQFTLAWDEVISATKYVVHNEQDEIIGETKGTSYTITNLKPGSTHTVYVSAVNETGEGKKSSFTQRTLPAEWGIDPDDPESSQPITVGDRGEHSVVIVVDSVEGADQYKVVDGDGNVIGIITAPETAKEIGGLESAKEYDNWSIIPINDAGEGQAAPIPPFVTLPSSNFAVSVGNPTTSSLTITVDSQLTNEIFVYAMNGNKLHRGKEKSFTVSNLSANKSYTFTVWTENSAGDKTEPKSATGQTLPVPSFGGSNLLQPKPPVDEQEAAHPHTAEPQTHTDQAGFEDIDRSFAKEEILALYAMGIVKGVSDSKFEPDRQVTRVEFASMLVRAMELQEASDAALTFEDVQRTAWYVPELSAAVLNGVAKGISAKEFRPLDPITREQAAKMIANAAYQGNVPAAQANYKDAGLIAWWAKPEVAALTTGRVITGYPDQTFKPKRDMTRAECAALIYRSLGLIN